MYIKYCIIKYFSRWLQVNLQDEQRTFLTLEDKTNLIAFKNENSSVGIREIAEKFGVGKTQFPAF